MVYIVTTGKGPKFLLKLPLRVRRRELEKSDSTIIDVMKNKKKGGGKQRNVKKFSSTHYTKKKKWLRLGVARHGSQLAGCVFVFKEQNQTFFPLLCLLLWNDPKLVSLSAWPCVSSINRRFVFSPLSFL